MYDSDLGKFYAADPAGQNHSPFSYVGNNPINFVDPSGEVGFFYALAQAAFVGGLSSAHNAYMAGGNPWQAGFQGALQGGLSAGLGAFAPSGVAGAGYNAGVSGLLSTSFGGGDFSSLGLSTLSSLPGAFQNSVLGSINGSLTASAAQATTQYLGSKIF